MDNITKLKLLVEEAEMQSNKLYVKNVKVAATKLRATMQDIKKVCQDIRKSALDHQHNLPTKTRPGKDGGAAAGEADEE